MFYHLGSTVGWLYFTSYEPTQLLKVDLGWWWSYDSAQCSQGWLCCCSQEVILLVVPQWLIIILHGRKRYWNPVWVSMWAPVVMLNENLVGLARWRDPVDFLWSVVKVKFWSNFEGRPETGKPLPSNANCWDSVLAILPGWTRACVLFCDTWYIAYHYSLSWWRSLVCLSLVDMKKKFKYWRDAEFGSFSNQAMCCCASSWMKLVNRQQERWSDAGQSAKPTAVPSTCSG